MGSRVRTRGVACRRDARDCTRPLGGMAVRGTGRFLSVGEGKSGMITGTTDVYVLDPVLLVILIAVTRSDMFRISRSLTAMFKYIFLLKVITTTIFLFVACKVHRSRVRRFRGRYFRARCNMSKVMQRGGSSCRPVFVEKATTKMILYVLTIVPAVVTKSVRTSSCCYNLSIKLLLFVLTVKIGLLIHIKVMGDDCSALLRRNRCAGRRGLFGGGASAFSNMC